MSKVDHISILLFVGGAFIGYFGSFSKSRRGANNFGYLSVGIWCLIPLIYIIDAIINTFK